MNMILSTSRTKTLLILFALTLLALVALACAPAIPSPTIAPTQVVGPKKGGKVTIALWQSPVTLNGLLGTQTVQFEVTTFVLEGLLKVLPDGTRVPALAKEVPSLQNGGVSADGKTITYKLLENVVWSDGTPFTCEDMQFSVKAIMTPGVGVVSTTGYEDIDSVECPNPTTAIVKYKNFFAPYIALFGPGELLPRTTGDTKDMKNWAYNRKPIGTGPFKVDEWVADDYVTLSRNEKYREQGKPYLDQIIIRIVPSTDIALQLLISGEVDVMWNNTEDQIAQLEKTAGVKFTTPLRIGGERLILNMAENKDPADPTKPHPILGDVRVRQALAYGINKLRIIDKLMGGRSLPGTSELNLGYYNCTDIKPYPYDPDKAKKLLDDAGWVPGADGIRIAKGAKYASDGTRLRLKYSTTSGDKLREDTQVLIAEDLRSVGVELYIENAPSSVVIGTWDGGSPRRRGNFDIIMYTSNAAIDPHSQMVNLFASSRIPSEKNKAGTNYSRFSDPKVDDLLKQAGSDPDPAKRKALYCQIAQIGYDQVPMIYLYQRGRLHSYRERLQGWVGTAWDNLGWNAQDWWVK